MPATVVSVNSTVRVIVLVVPMTSVTHIRTWPRHVYENTQKHVHVDGGEDTVGAIETMVGVGHGGMRNDTINPGAHFPFPYTFFDFVRLHDRIKCLAVRFPRGAAPRVDV